MLKKYGNCLELTVWPGENSVIFWILVLPCHILVLPIIWNLAFTVQCKRGSQILSLRSNMYVKVFFSVNRINGDIGQHVKMLLKVWNFFFCGQDHDYQGIVSHHLPAILSVFSPDLILYDAGVDPHHKDELGRLSLSDQG